ncbi:MAG: SDR family oxidoreductase [Bacteroidetes bacterium]|jgi:putative NADH-flavin reductase|nr:SDR family oxidoreductase [Bacteroidota bacterium]
MAKCVVIGAGGRVGQNVLLQLLEQGHEARAFVRHADAVLLRHPRLSFFTGDALNTDQLAEAIAGMEVVIATLGSRAMDKPISLMSQAMQQLVSVMQQQGIRRVLTVGGAGILQLDERRLRAEAADFPPFLQHVTQDHYRVYQILLKSGLDWTMACPPYMPSAEATGIYRAQRDYLPDGGTQISAADCAHFLASEALACAYLGHRVGLAY